MLFHFTISKPAKQEGQLTFSQGYGEIAIVVQFYSSFIFHCFKLIIILYCRPLCHNLNTTDDNVSHNQTCIVFLFIYLLFCFYSKPQWWIQTFELRGGGGGGTRLWNARLASYRETKSRLLGPTGLGFGIKSKGGELP